MKVQNDYSYLKGFNYEYLDTATYNHEEVDRDMAYAERLTLNSCRLFMNMQSWRNEPEKFREILKDLVCTAWSHGISTTPILLRNSFGDDYATWYSPVMQKEVPVPGWYDKNNWAMAEEYVASSIEAVKDEPGLLFWDVMNEPSWNDFINGATDEKEKSERLEMVWEFVRHMIRFVREKDPVNALGVGHTFIEDTEYSKTGDMVDIIIFHDYLETRSRVEATCKRAIELSKKYGKPVINNETGCLCRSNPYDVAIQMANKYKIGYYLFELMIPPEGQRWSRVHGIVYPDGTVRDPSIVAAILGFFRNRNETAIYPDVNQEGHADKAIAYAKEMLDRRAPADELLEAAEYCANLLETGELVPMAYPPTAQIEAFRRSEKKDFHAIRAFTYELIETLRKACEMA